MPLRWEVTRPWWSMSGVPSGWRMMLRNWYRVLNASIAIERPRRSSRVRGDEVLPLLEEAGQGLARLDLRLDPNLRRQLQLRAHVADDPDELAGVALREDLLVHLRVQVHGPVGERFHGDVLRKIGRA